jgi:hypothetical protein
MLVYGETMDLALAREAQRLGAFYEPRTRIHQTLAGYLTRQLPPADRRNAAQGDRRAIFRGGRRSTESRLIAH